MYQRSLSIAAGLLSLILIPSPLLAQSITPAADGTGTQVLQEGERYTITGGTRAQENLFHSFERLGLSPDEIATFLSQPDIANILGRVTGGDASLIDGLLQVQGGNANLYLMNPAGIVFGPNARLDLSGSFFATTATGIGFGESWFNAIGDNTYADLVGNPDSFAFSLEEGGAIANLANLTVNPGESITLLGSTVTNTGTLTAPEGTITLAAVPGENRVRLSQTGSLLSLELDAANNTWDAGLNPVNLTPLSLPELLTGGNLADASQITVNPDGTVRLGGADVPVQDGTTLVSGTLDAAGTAEAEINVLGDRIALLNASLDVSGTNGGGNIRIGGEYQGNGPVFNASRTFVSADSQLLADAVNQGDGGRIITWADETTRFYGTLTARGGSAGGNGGFAEVSGLDYLDFAGVADLGASLGQTGTLLLDPTNIEVVAGANAPAQLAANDQFADPGVNNTINNGTINAAIANVVLQATNNITVSAPINIATANVGFTAQANNAITINAGVTNNGGDVNLLADGPVSIAQPIRTQGGAINVRGSNDLGNGITTFAELNSGGGAINLTGVSTYDAPEFRGIATFADVISNGGDITFTGTSAREHGIVTFQTLNSGTGNITLNGTGGTANGNDPEYDGFNWGVVIEGPVTTLGGAIDVTGRSLGIGPRAIGIVTQRAFGSPNGGTVESNGGTISFTGISNGAQGIVITREMNSGGGNISLDGTSNGTGELAQGVAIGAPVTTTGGNLAVRGRGANAGIVTNTSNNNGITIGDLNTGLGDINLTADGTLSTSTNVQGRNITLVANEIDVLNSIGGTGVLTLQPNAPGQAIALGSTDNTTTALDLTAQELGFIQNGFSSITIGRADGTGGINVAGVGGLTFNDPLTLRSPGTNSGDITINNALTLSADNSLTVLSGGAIFVNQPITTNGGRITLTANADNVDVGRVRLDAPLTSNGGGINVTGISRDTTTIGQDVSGIVVNGVMNSGGGAILLEGTALQDDDGISVAQPIQSQGGAITLVGTADGGFFGEGILLVAPITSNGGTIRLTGTSRLDDGIHLFTSGADSGGGDIFLTGSSDNLAYQSLALDQVVVGGAGVVTLTGDRISIGTGISGTGQLIVQPETLSFPVLLGGTDDTAFLSDADFARINGFTTVTLGRNDATGTVQLITVPTLEGTTTIAGGSTLTGPNQVTIWTLNRDSGSLTSGGNTISFVNIEGLIGNAGDDDFVFNSGGSFSGTIAPGDGTDTLSYAAVTTPITINLAQVAGFENLVGGSATTLAGSNTANTWTVTGTDAGRINDLTFTSVPILQGGSGDDSFTLANGGQITGQILGGGGTDQLMGGGASSRAANNWVITGETTGTLNGTSFAEFERLTGSAGGDRFEFTSDNAFGGDIEGLTGELQLTGETVNLDGNIAAQGNVLIQARQEIRVGAIDTSSPTGNGGNVTLDPIGDIQVRSINAEGGDNGIGGTVDITAGRFFRATDAFTNRDGQRTSISTAGGLGGGAITIRHGGNGLTPFVIGENFGDNGSRAAITNGTDTFAIGEFFLGRETRGSAQILTNVSADRTRVLPPCQANCNDTNNPEDDASSPGAASPEEADEDPEVTTVLAAQDRLLTIAEQTGIPPALVYISFVSPDVALPNDFEQREAIASQQFSDYLGQPNPTEAPLLTTQAQDTDELELLLILPNGDPTRYRVSGVTRAMVQQVRQQLVREVTAPNRFRTDFYRASAQQLYEWLIAPLEADLEEAGISNLAFVLDAGLRSLPLSILHDGEQFLIERYSIGLMPSLSLTDTRHRDLRNLPILAMGASEFDNMLPLPAVPMELETITQVVPNSVALLNQDFTQANLQKSRFERPYGIVHLATHAEFLPGQVENSFIQFDDRRLLLNALRQLRLNDPPLELLVLSACRTALGDEQAELGFGGLAVQAGVRSVLASLWYISDTGTLVFMNEFYRQLQEAPTRSEALRRTQLALLRGDVLVEDDQLVLSEGTTVAIPPEIIDTSINLSHPYFWASFTMIGSPW